MKLFSPNPVSCDKIRKMRPMGRQRGAAWMDDLRFPIGVFELDSTQAVHDDQLNSWIDEIAALPEQLRQAVTGMDDSRLDTAYRPGGWTVRQVVHHLADSHMNAYTRCKLALTEEQPTIKPYLEDQWAELADGRSAPIEPSLILIEGLHDRWTRLLRSLDRGQLERVYYHPELGRTVDLVWVVGSYAWHGKHHLAHITRLQERMGWE